MALQPPLKELSIGLAEDGFYKGFNNIVALASKIIIALIVLWCFVWPDEAAKILGELKNWSFANLNYYYTWGVAFYVIVCLAIALYPKWGKTFTVFPTAGPGSPGEWQGWWSIFYWAWWIAFAPFVGIFLARISKNRTIREFVLGAILAPSMMCFFWFTLLGGTAIDLELNGTAQGAIYAKSLTAQLYEVINIMLSSGLAQIMSILIVILLLTYLVTSADSAVLVVNTINAGGEYGSAGRWHIIIWGLILSAVIAALLLVGGLEAIKSAMIIAAVPFSFVMILMGVSLIKALIKDGLRG